MVYSTLNRGRIIPSIDRPVSFTMSADSPQVRVEPVSLDQAKAALRFSSTSEDLLIKGWIMAARSLFEEQAGRQLVDAVWEYALDGPPQSARIELPRPPLVSVSSVTYDDGSGTEQTLDASLYRVLPSVLLEGSPLTGVTDPYCTCGSIELVSGSSWPATIGSRSLRIRRTCGYGTTPEDMPALVQAALYFLIGHFHRNRSEVTDPGPGRTLVQIPMGADMLIRGFKYAAMQTHLPTCL